MIKRILRNKNFISLLNEEVRKFKLNIFYLFISIIATAVIDVNLLKFIGRFTEVVSKGILDYPFFLIFFSIFLLRLLFSFILYYQTSYLSNIFTLRLKNKIFNKILNSKSDLDKAFSKGDIFYRMFVEIGLLQGKLILGSIYFIKDILFLLVLCINLLIASQFLFFSLIFFYIVFFIYNKSVLLKIEKLNKITLNKNAELSNFLHELLIGRKDIIIYDLKSDVSKKIDSFGIKLENNYKNNGKYYGLNALTLESFIMLFFITILYLLIFQKSPLSQTVTSLAYLLAMVWPIKEINNHITSLSSLIPSLERLENLLKESETPLSAFQRSTVTIKDQSPQLLISNMVFNYGPECPFLFNGDSFEFSKGIHLIKGKNGTGKTTFLEIIAGLKHPSQGSMVVQVENDINSICFAQQNPFLFKESILENLKIVEPQFSEKEICDILNKYELLDFFETLPQGIHQFVGDDGEFISTGEKQLVSIMRALMIDPEILLLDEVTSSLNRKLSIKLLKNIVKYRNEKITILVSHQQFSEIKFDSIINFDVK